MGFAEQKVHMSFEGFLDWVQTQEGRFEFIAGEVFAMTGGTRAHSTAATHLTIALGVHLKSSHCRVYNSDMGVRVVAVDALYFPDVSVSCEQGSGSDLYLSEPNVIVEVLSPSTERFDRGRKFHDYWKIPSLREYVLIDTDGQFVDLYQRTAAADWTLHSFRDGMFRLASLDFEMPLVELFR